MSTGSTSPMGGKHGVPQESECPPTRGKVLSELLQRLEEDKRRTSAGTPESARTTASGSRRVVAASRAPAGRARSRQQRLLTVLSVAMVIVGLAILAAYWIRPEAALPSPDGLLQTRIQMKALELGVRLYYARYNRMPTGNISNVLAVLAGHNVEGANPDRVIFMKLRQPEYRFGRIVKHGDIDADWNYLDGWGRPMRLEVYPETLSMRIRSLGPNGKDEGGKGDDIEMLILANL